MESVMESIKIRALKVKLEVLNQLEELQPPHSWNIRATQFHYEKTLDSSEDCPPKHKSEVS